MRKPDRELLPGVLIAMSTDLPGFVCRGGLMSAWILGLLAAPVTAETVEELLEKLQAKRVQVQTLHQEKRTTLREGETTRESTVHRFEKRSGGIVRSRVVTKTSTSKKGVKGAVETETLAVSDGKNEWRQVPVAGKTMVFRTKAGTGTDLDEVRAAIAEGKARIKGREHILRESCVIIEILSGGRGTGFKATYWVSERYGILLKSVSRRADRTGMEMVTTTLKVDEPIDDGQFTYTPPANATVVNADAIKKKPSAGASSP